MKIFWFRRDLRLEDNRGLYEALQGDEPVLPIFIFDKEILDELPRDDARVSFIYDTLSGLHRRLEAVGKSLAVFVGQPLPIIRQLLSEHNVSALYANRDYEPYARQRDKEIYEELQQHGIPFRAFKDQVIFEKHEVAKDDGSPYVVYTPYSRKWKEQFRKSGLTNYDSAAQLHHLAAHEYPFPALEDIGFTRSAIKVKAIDTSPTLIDRYEETRNFPALDATSHLGPHLRFGTVSIRRMVQLAVRSRKETFLNELIWREFFMQILWHFPHTTHKSFRERYDGIVWQNDEADFKSWCEGRTGYPIVDAGMRELNQTGYMHNRVRMITASFLCKHLLIDWRWGEAYFAAKLLDYEQASNVGNWQWAAGSGVDAAPYFRIFNPSEQIKKFDKDLAYIRKWIPEYGTPAYPEPVVAHTFARERCLAVYKKAVQ